MRRAVKNHDSEIVRNNLRYLENNSANNSKISTILYQEQKGFCAYTEEYIGRADARDIDHFNPNIKGTSYDGYQNWFLTKHQWNKEKSSKWPEPVLHPAAVDFEDRIVYDSGDYRANSKDDIEAENLITLIKLDDAILADQRKKYIKRKKDEQEKYGMGSEEFFKILIDSDISQISYIRAIQEEFDLNIWELISIPRSI